MRRTLLAAAVLAIALPACNAKAQVSCYAEASAGGAITSNKLDDGMTAVTVAGDGYFGGLGVGCDYKFDRFLIGGLARYDLNKISTDMLGQRLSAGDGTWTAAARAGVFLQPAILVYGIAGISGTELDIAGIETLDTKGLLLGAGLELEIAPLIAVFAEFNHTKYNAWHDGPAELQTSSNAVRAGLKIRFNSLLPQ